jgi:hypothetical protein
VRISDSTWSSYVEYTNLLVPLQIQIRPSCSEANSATDIAVNAHKRSSSFVLLNRSTENIKMFEITGLDPNEAYRPVIMFIRKTWF